MIEPRPELNTLLTQLLAPRLGHVPARWPEHLWSTLRQLAARARTNELETLKRLLAQPDPVAISALLKSATVAHTLFFRHPEQFAELEVRLETLAREGKEPVRIWSAACASGEEPYSIAMLAERLGVEVSILATDVSPETIAIARLGHYEPHRSIGIPNHPEDEPWQAPQQLKDQVRFAAASLVEINPALNETPFHIIFCRNVLIYFDRRSAAQLLDRLQKDHLLPDGVIAVAPVEALIPPPRSLVQVSFGWLARAALPTRESGPPAARRASPARVAKLQTANKPVALAAPAPTTAGVQASLETAARMLASGYPDVAEELLQAVIAGSPEEARAWFLLGEVLVLRDEPLQARIAFQQAAQAAETNPPEEVDGETFWRAAIARANQLR
jgi:chemotaxis methyl-accepting protein methylase